MSFVDVTQYVRDIWVFFWPFCRKQSPCHAVPNHAVMLPFNAQWGVCAVKSL